MKKSIKKLLSVILCAAIIAGFMSVCFSAQASEYGKVRVIVKNDTYKTADGAAWEGVLIDEWVDIDGTATILTAFIDAVEKNNLTQKGAENGYISEVNGIGSGDNGEMSGWMASLNDWFTNELLGDYTIENGKLESGDEICVAYTSNWGEDLGSSWYNNLTTLNNLEISEGTLKPEFESSVLNYELEIDSETASLTVLPTATNKNFQVRTYKNEYTPTISHSEYKRNTQIEVSDGDVLYVGVGDESWPSMGASEGATVYRVNVRCNSRIQNKIDDTAQHLLTLDSTAVSSTGGEWMVTGLARSGKISGSYVDEYYRNVVNYLTENGSEKLDRSKVTENARVVIALTSIEKDVSDVAGFNLLSPLADFAYVKKQGLTGCIWTLTALDTLTYDVPQTDASDITTRDKLIEYILSKQLADGGWDRLDTQADPDVTSMAVTALAPYYSKNDKVKDAVDRAVEALSEIQQDNGGYSSYGEINSNSCAQVITALSSVGINADGDERFIKNGCSVIDALMMFSVENGFSYTGSDYNQMATEQGFYSLAAYQRYLQGENALFDMSDLLTAENGLGEVSGDGELTITDCTIIQQALAHLTQLSEHQYMLADFNGDKTVTITDATAIQKYLAKL